MSNYLRKLLRDSQRGKLKKGAMTYVHIQHDDWCDFLNNRGDCNCSPVISYKEVQNAEEMQAAFDETNQADSVKHG